MGTLLSLIASAFVCLQCRCFEDVCCADLYLYLFAPRACSGACCSRTATDEDAVLYFQAIPPHEGLSTAHSSAANLASGLFNPAEVITDVITEADRFGKVGEGRGQAKGKGNWSAWKGQGWCCCCPYNSVTVGCVKGQERRGTYRQCTH